jgi:glycosyltransferase involved in cell wall biosynthesis
VLPSSGAQVAQTTRPLHIVLLDYRDTEHPEAGGAEVYMREIFERVAASGHRVTWISGAYRGARREEWLGNLRALRFGNKATANYSSVIAALRLARRERVDLFVENICKIPFFLPAVTKRPVLPIVLHLFGDTVFREVNPLMASYVWLHERPIPYVYRGLPFVALSQSTALDLERRGVQCGQVEIVPPGLNFERYRSGTTGKSEHPLLLYVGRIKRYKQIDIALRAFAKVRRQLPAARFVIVGKGDDRPRLEAVIRSLGLNEAVRFTGFVGEEEKIEWMRRAHALVYPSPKEGWGISATEAAACGTPVVASDSEGLREAVSDGTSGFLVRHADVDAWAHRMTQLLTDDDLRERMGKAAVEWSRRFDWDVGAETVRRVIERVAANVGSDGRRQ